MAASVPFILGTICQHAPHPQRHFPHPSCHGHQLLILVPDWLHLSIRATEEELRLVEQVQLRHQCCLGQWCVARSCITLGTCLIVTHRHCDFIARHFLHIGGQ